MNKPTALIIGTFILLFISGCKNDIENPAIESYKSYIPLEVGKFISYRIDSTIVNNFRTGFLVRSHIIKDSVEEKFIDFANNTAFRIVRYILEGNQWNPINTFSVAVLDNKVEFTEENRRIIKLVNPINNNERWKGNSYINYSPFFTNSDYKDWEYRYENINQDFSINNQFLSNSLTVVSYDSVKNIPFYNKGYYNYAKGYEVYVKNIGKVYQDIINWEYQVLTRLSNCQRIRCTNLVCDTSYLDCNLINCDSIRRLQGNTIKCDTLITSYFYTGYGIKLSMINHN